MNFSTNFLAFTQPVHTNGSVGACLDRESKGFSVSTTYPTTPSVVMKVATELEAWQAFNELGPNALDSLWTSKRMYLRALGRRAELILTEGETAMERYTEHLFNQVLQIHEAVMEALGATRITREKAKPRYTRRSHVFSWLNVVSKLSLPYTPDAQHTVVQVAPCPFEQDAFAVRVSMPSESNEAACESQKRLANLADLLEGRGIKLAPVFNGTSLADL